MLKDHIVTDEFLAVPLSGNKIEANINGIVRYCETGEVIPVTINEQNQPVVWLSLWWGCGHYSLALIMAHTFKPLQLPFPYWKNIRVLHIDDDFSNVHPSNLIWKFPIGLESHRYPGYAFVPGHTRYAINRHGAMIHLASGKELVASRVEGYFLYSTRNDLGNKARIGRHRALALAWLDYPANADKLDVNHINGIRGSDTLNNLEWASRKRNCDHAYENGLRNDNNYVLTRNFKTGEIVEHYSQAECARYLAISPSTLWERLRMKNQPLFTGFIQIKYSNDDTPWREPTETEIREMEAGNDCTVMGRNVKTGKIREFASQAEVVRELEISEAPLNESIRNKEQRIWDNYWQFQLKRELQPWREPENLEEERDRALLGRTVLARNVVTGEIREYVSAMACARDFGLSDLTIAVRLRDTSQKLYPGYWQFKRAVDKTPWREVKDPDAELSGRNYPVSIMARDILTGKEWTFDRMTLAAEHTGVDICNVKQRLSAKFRLPYLKYAFKYPDEEWPVYNELEMSVLMDAINRNKPMSCNDLGWVLTNVKTGEVKVSSDIHAICDLLGVTKAYAYSLARANKLFRETWSLTPCFSNVSCPRVISVTEPS